jgi:hypothetical protein
LCETANILKSERAQLYKNLSEATVQQEKATWDKMGLEKCLKQQEEQMLIYESQKEEREENQSILRRENLLQLKERDAIA